MDTNSEPIRLQTLFPPWLILILQNTYVVLLYFLTGVVGLQFASIGNQVTLIWPPSGVALAFMFLLRFRVWPAVALGAFLVNLSSGAPLSFALIVAGGNTLQAVIGAWLLRRVGFDARMETLRDVFAFLGYGCAVSVFMSSGIGSLGLLISGIIPAEMFLRSFGTWWCGDAIGVLVFGAPILVWSSQVLVWSGWKRAVEGLLMGIVLALTGWQIYLYGTGSDSPFLLNFLIFPLVVWAVIRFGQRGAALVNLVVVILAIIGLVQHRGPFYHEDLSTSLLSLQGFVAMLLVSSFMLGSVIEERRKAEEGRTAMVRQRQLYALLLDMSSSLDLEQVMKDIVRRTTQTLSAEAGAFVLLSPDGRTLNFAECYHVDGNCGKNKELLTIEEELCWDVLRAGDLHTLDFLDQPKRYTYLLSKGYTCWLGAPIQVADEMIGVISLFRTKRINSFQPADNMLARLIGRQAGIVIQNARSYAELQRLAITDPLTGLFNRRYFMELAAMEVKRAVQKKAGLAVMMIDLDFFKVVNDTYGHVVGDLALSHLAQILKQGLRENDILARYGGEEFLALLNNVGYDQTHEIAERLRQQVEQQPLFFRGEQIDLQISVGVILTPPDCDDLACLVERADEAMYQAKNHGRNCVMFWEG
ncbi:MAG TPA: diguanylate cyclase [Anaerolineaceae bacterium]|nr:diguanylate cyclase [Anaerolineaceae bacterium]